jgi:hypothetical protein
MARVEMKPGFKRFYIPLNEEKYMAYQAMLKEFGAPRGTGALLIDEYIKGMVDMVCPIIKKTKDAGGKITFADFLVMFGNIMKDAQDEQLKL